MGDLLTKLLALMQDIVITPLIWVWPFKWSVILPGSQAIRFTWGRPSQPLANGVFWATTGQTIEKRHIRQLYASTEVMPLLTEDSLPIRVGGVSVYTIINLLKFLTGSEDSPALLIDATEAAMREAMSKVPFEDLAKDSVEVEGSIALRVAEICKGLGIRILRFRFQSVEVVDPIGRAFLSSCVLAPAMFETVKRLAIKFELPVRDVLAVVSPNVQFTSDIETASLETDEDSVVVPDEIPT